MTSSLVLRLFLMASKHISFSVPAGCLQSTQSNTDLFPP